MTVSEAVSTNKLNKVWLCPHVVHNPSLQIYDLLRGVECTKSTVPVRLLNMEVTKTFTEAGFNCIIWRNTLQTENELKSEQMIVADAE